MKLHARIDIYTIVCIMLPPHYGGGCIYLGVATWSKKQRGTVFARCKSKMDRLTEMEAFATVLDQGGFTNAAKKMGISKSAVSKRVSALEARLGARLLNRTTRRVSTTEIGATYYRRICRVLNDLDEADTAASTSANADQSNISERSAFLEL